MLVAESTVAWPEVVWMVFGAIGAIFSMFNVSDAIKDLHALTVVGKNGLLKTIAKAVLFQEGLRTTKCLIVVAIGAFAATAPPANTNAPVTATSYIITIGLFFLVAAMMMATIVARKMRHNTMEILRQRDGKID